MLKKWISMMLILAFAVALMPLNAGIALAEDAAPEAPLAAEGEELEMTDEGDVPEQIEEVVPELDEFTIGMDEDEGTEGAEPAPQDGTDLAEPEFDGETAVAAPLPEDLPEEPMEAPTDPATIPKAYDAFPDVPELPGGAIEEDGEYVAKAAMKHTVSITQSGDIVTVKGSISAPHYFYGLYVDTKLVAPVTGSSVNQTINMKNFATGYHTVWLGVIEGQGSTTICNLIPKQYMVSNNITDRPSYAGVVEVYHNRLDIYPYDMYMHNQAGLLYLEYSADGGKTWSRSGYMKANLIKLFIQQAYTISGLKPGTTYQTRLRYGDVITYSNENSGGDDKSYFFGGPVFNTATITTGMAEAPKIKSVTAKAVKIKRHKARNPGYYNYVGGQLFWHKAWTERWYTCNVKVTVKLKKKPGTNGIWITFDGQRKFVKGNKKSYSATFTPTINYFAKKPKGRYKFNVSVCSGQSADWGGYSPSWSKVKKLK